MFDTLLPIPDAEYPAFYPIGIKASCVWQYQSILNNIVQEMKNTINNTIANIASHIDNNIMNNNNQYWTILWQKLTWIFLTILMISIDDNTNQY
jgi:hypothetical protein